MDIAVSQPAPETETAVFRGTPRACAEQGLVLDSKGISYRVEVAGREACLWVASSMAAIAAEELMLYAAEPVIRREPPAGIVPFSGAAAGAFAYCAILICIAYLAGERMFGLDWFAVGALDAGMGRAGEGWRSITALTLHLDQSHLLGNLLFGAGAGFLAARMFGPGVAWLSILLCAGVANYADMLMSPSSHRAIGASTAVFAALGILTGFGWGRRELHDRARRVYRWGPLFGGVFLLAFLGAGDEHVDVLGHLLGFITGVTAGVGFSWWGTPTNRRASLQVVAGLAAVAVLSAAWFLACRYRG